MIHQTCAVYSRKLDVIRCWHKVQFQFSSLKDQLLELRWTLDIGQQLSVLTANWISSQSLQPLHRDQSIKCSKQCLFWAKPHNHRTFNEMVKAGCLFWSKTPTIKKMTNECLFCQNPSKLINNMHAVLVWGKIPYNQSIRVHVLLLWGKIPYNQSIPCACIAFLEQNPIQSINSVCMYCFCVAKSPWSATKPVSNSLL